MENDHDKYKPREEAEGSRPDTPPTPPELPEDLDVERAWAEKLGMDYDTDVALKEEERRREEAARAAKSPKEQIHDYYQAMRDRHAHPSAGNPSDPATNQGFPPQAPPPYFTDRDPYMQGHRQEPMPPTFMLWAIIATICCCLPAGVVAIVMAASVSTKYYARDYEGARRASRNAEIWIIVAIVLGVVFNAFYFPISVMSNLLDMF